jgi:ComF family protein
MKRRGSNWGIMNNELGIRGLVLKIKKFVFDTLFPIECLGCRREGKWFCDECLAKIKVDAHSLSGESLDKILTFYSYDNELLKQAIHLLKYKFVEDLADPLGKLFSAEIKKVISQIGKEVILMSVPLHKKRFLERGFNQAELLSKTIAEGFGWLVENKALERVHYTAPQTDLEEKDRYKNIRGAFAVKDASKIINKKIVLIDDVLTTGATMEECARVLKTNGAREVWGVALAKG